MSSAFSWHPRLKPEQNLCKKQSGFTLVEVLVAMAIMAIIALMAWQGVDSIVRARSINQARLEKLLRVNTVLAQWEQDLNALEDTERFTKITAFNFNGSAVSLTRRSEQGLQLVVWSLRSNQLYRWASPVVTTQDALQNHFKASQQFLGNEKGQLKTLSNVSEWQIYYFRDNAWSNAQSSAGTALSTESGAPAPAPAGAAASVVPEAESNTSIKPPPNTPQNTPPNTATKSVMPSGVRLVLNFSNADSLNGRITRDVELGPQSP
jgi:general secretion pathway protein J